MEAAVGQADGPQLPNRPWHGRLCLCCCLSASSLTPRSWRASQWSAGRVWPSSSPSSPIWRGYGDRSKPPAGPDNAGYAKRALALDQVETMAALGFDRFFVAGHDRGARVAHRLALDHAERAERLALLDIVPTLYRFETIDQKAATGSFHWFFLIQPGGLPERLIGA